MQNVALWVTQNALFYIYVLKMFQGRTPGPPTTFIRVTVMRYSWLCLLHVSQKPRLQNRSTRLLQHFILCNDEMRGGRVCPVTPPIGAHSFLTVLHVVLNVFPEV